MGLFEAILVKYYSKDVLVYYPLGHYYYPLLNLLAQVAISIKFLGYYHQVFSTIKFIKESQG